MALYGLTISGPLGHVLYAALDCTVTGSGVGATLVKLGISNGIIAPLQTAVYLAALSFSQVCSDSCSAHQCGARRSCSEPCGYYPIAQIPICPVHLLWSPLASDAGGRRRTRPKAAAQRVAGVSQGVSCGAGRRLPPPASYPLAAVFQSGRPPLWRLRQRYAKPALIREAKGQDGQGKGEC